MDEEPYLKDDDLLPCPHCGGDAGVSCGTQAGDRPWWYIECDECSATADSVESWNRRTAAPEELDRLKLAFGEFAYKTGQSEGVWFVDEASDAHRLAEECEKLYLARRDMNNLPTKGE